MPADAAKTSLKELKRLKKMPQQMPEHAMLRYDAVLFASPSTVLTPAPSTVLPSISCCYDVVPSLMTLATIHCRTTLSSEALMSCVGLTLSFHNAHKYPDTSVFDAHSLSFPLSFHSPPNF